MIHRYADQILVDFAEWLNDGDYFNPEEMTNYASVADLVDEYVAATQRPDLSKRVELAARELNGWEFMTKSHPPIFRRGKEWKLVVMDRVYRAVYAGIHCDGLTPRLALQGCLDALQEDAIKATNNHTNARAALGKI